LESPECGTRRAHVALLGPATPPRRRGHQAPGADRCGRVGPMPATRDVLLRCESILLLVVGLTPTTRAVSDSRTRVATLVFRRFARVRGEGGRCRTPAQASEISVPSPTLSCGAFVSPGREGASSRSLGWGSPSMATAAAEPPASLHHDHRRQVGAQSACHLITSSTPDRAGD
jgi:hypothetical protein